MKDVIHALPIQPGDVLSPSLLASVSEQCEDLLYVPVTDAGCKDHFLVWNRREAILAHIWTEDGLPHLVLSHRLSPGEGVLLHALLEAYPQYVSLELMLACYLRRSTQVSEEELGQSRAAVLRALDEQHLDRLFHPVRKVVSRLRLKMQPVGMDVLALAATGYQLAIGVRLRHAHGPPGVSQRQRPACSGSTAHTAG